MDLTFAITAMMLGLMAFGLLNANWRIGVFLIVGAGFLQDPLRKFVPGEPVAISAIVAVLMLLVWGVGLTRFAGYRSAMSLGAHYPQLVRALIAFGALVLFQSLVTVFNFGSLALAGIGLIAYLSPLPAIWIGWWFCRTDADVRQLLFCYFAFGILVASGVYLSWMDTDWDILRQIGGGLVVYDQILGAIDTHSGFMRVAEIAAWHLGAAGCFSIILATNRPTVGRTVMFALAIAFMVPAIFLTGRRKALAMIGLFVGILSVLLQFSRNRDARKASLALVGLALGTLSILFYLTEDASDAAAFRPYTQRGESVVGDGLERFYELGIMSAYTAITYVGFFGYGAGAFSQGGQHFGAVMEWGSAEGGLGKIVSELGVPGLLILLWVFSAAFTSVRRRFRSVAGSASSISTISLSLMAFFAVNVIVFITASQIYGDPFVLIIVGIVFGGILSTSRKVVPRAQVGDRATMPHYLPRNPARTQYWEGRS